ncbi:MAG: cob(I)yrinic acid a,c-diamide adenosyltransferase [Acidobacteriota bacterium]|nr:cob(I)yrinic acid a,c-diamide adenosyltransferase [Acidobacteriota bacterium]
MTRIYTRTGDDGTTGQAGGGRTNKDSLLIETCGQLDELNAMIGVVRSSPIPEKADRVLALVQNELFAVGAEIMDPEGTARKGACMNAEKVENLEREIDALEKELEPLRKFILPGGAREAAEMHLTRAVARRVERRCVAVSRIQKVSPQVLCYINRLSDLFFVLARYLNRHRGVAEPQLSPTGSWLGGA